MCSQIKHGPLGLAKGSKLSMEELPQYDHLVQASQQKLLFLTLEKISENTCRKADIEA